MKVITTISTKGGVGKTTLTANLAAFLADQGNSVLMIDADVQPSLTQSYKIDSQANHGLQHLITSSAVQPQDVATTLVDQPNLNLVISDDKTDTLRKWALEAPDGRIRLRHILRERFSSYDFIFIDTQGAVGPIQEACIYAADMLISPVVPDKLTASEFVHNTVSFLSRLQESGQWMGISVPPLYAVLNMVEMTNDADSYSSQIKSIDFSGISKVPIHLTNTFFSRSVVWKNAASMRTPAHKLEEKTTRKSGSALEVITALSEELKLI